MTKSELARRLQMRHMNICAGDDSISRFEDVIMKLTDEDNFFAAIDEELIPALKDDLMKAKSRSWRWQFWR